MQIQRRKFITGLGALFVAAPAIVRAASIMPVSAAKIGPYLSAVDICNLTLEHIGELAPYGMSPAMVALPELWSQHTAYRFGDVVRHDGSLWRVS